MGYTSPLTTTKMAVTHWHKLPSCNDNRCRPTEEKVMSHEVLFTDEEATYGLISFIVDEIAD